MPSVNKMTVNKIIVLLDVHRGTATSFIGSDDLQDLISLGYIGNIDNEPVTTDKGKNLVNAIKAISNL